MSRGRPKVYDYSSPETFSSADGRLALKRHLKKLKDALYREIDANIRRYCCFICACLFSRREVETTPCKYEMIQLENSVNMTHISGMQHVYPNLHLQFILEESELCGIYVCKEWCLKRWKMVLSPQNKSLPLCPTLEPLRPFYFIPVSLRDLCGVEAGLLSLIDMSVNLGGGVGRGYYLALKGDVRTDEDLCGSVGTTVGRMKLTGEDRIRARNAMVALKRDGHHAGVRDYLLTGERNRYNVGMSICEPERFRGVGIEGRGCTTSSATMIAGHAIPQRECVVRPRMRYGRKLNLRAGVLYSRDSRTPQAVFWDSDIEALLFPQLYLNGTGGHTYTKAKGISWTEHVRKRLWSINPMFRKTPLYLTFLFDFGEKVEMHRANEKTFIPDNIEDCDAEEYNIMSERTARGFENICRKELGRGRRGVATASEKLGKPNVFQTETMNEMDMFELQKMSYRLTPTGDLTVDDVTTAIMYKVRQIALLETAIPMTSLKGVDHGSIRLEIQSGRSYRLHAHDMIKVKVNDDELMKAISASLSSLNPSARKAYEPVSRHYCLSTKCGNGCVYGYPVLVPSSRTHRVYDDTDESDCEGKVIYKREVGNDGIEKDERVTPFLVELSSIRVCHGAFLICTEELATGYSGKYSFKRSGGMGNDVGSIALADVITGGDIQFLRTEKEGWKAEMMKEKLGMRIVSMMEIALHLCGESIVHSTYHVRELWVVLPYEKKRFLDNGIVRKGIPGGVQLREYYRRKTSFEHQSFESYYECGCVHHPTDYENEVRVQTDFCQGDEHSNCNSVLVRGFKKTLLARVMPIRGKGMFLVNMVCWSLILRNVPHRDTKSVWDHENGETSWDAAARSGALGAENTHLRRLEALKLAMSIGSDIEERFGKKMGLSELERERDRDYIYAATTEAVKFITEAESFVGEERNSVDDFDDANLNALQIDISPQPLSLLSPVEESEELMNWRDKFRLKGWVIRGNHTCEEGTSRRQSLIDKVPANVQCILDSLSAYPSQVIACMEILDSIVTSPQGLRRFISGAAGRGKSFLKKALIRILRSVGLNVQVLAVAALVAQDDGGNGGSTIASAFNMRGVSPTRYDEKAYELSKVDVFIVDEISFASTKDARAMEYYIARGLYLRAGGIQNLFSNRVPRHVSHQRHLKRGTDPWSLANIIVFGDFMQLRAPGGEALYKSERLWGTQFRSKTLFLNECVRSSDSDLMKLCDMCRSFSARASPFSNVSTSSEILRMIRNRTITSMKDVKLLSTVLSPRFERAITFCEAGLMEIGSRGSECLEKGLGEQVYQIDAEYYVIGNRNLPVESCIGMESGDKLEAVKYVLDKDHSRLRRFTFRTGMIAVVTENERGATASSNSDVSWWDDLDENNRTTSNSNAIAARDFSSTTKLNSKPSRKNRLLNGERVTIVGAIHGKGNQKGKIVGVKVVSTAKRWDGVRSIRMSRSGGEGLNKPHLLEQRTVRYIKNGEIKQGRVARRQVPLILELALTIHKAQGSTLSTTVLDMGCSPDAYTGGLFYTAITRVRKLADLYFIDVPEADFEILRRITTCEETLVEMEKCKSESEELKTRSEKVWAEFQMASVTVSS